MGSRFRSVAVAAMMLAAGGPRTPTVRKSRNFRLPEPKVT